MLWFDVESGNSGEFGLISLILGNPEYGEYGDCVYSKVLVNFVILVNLGILVSLVIFVDFCKSGDSSVVMNIAALLVKVFTLVILVILVNVVI